MKLNVWKVGAVLQGVGEEKRRQLKHTLYEGKTIEMLIIRQIQQNKQISIGFSYEN